MVIMSVIKLINGALALVQTVQYSDGSTVKRIIDLHTGIPVDIIK
jgi:hypothetical protein